MPETLQAVKTRLSQRHLGRHGIHAIGMSEVEGAVCLYVTSMAGLEGTGTLSKIKEQAAPFKVVVIEERQALLGDEPRKSDEREGESRT
jgi:DNA-binding NarL/FixJ family response regulator